MLDVCFGKDDNEIYTACLDWDVRRYVALYEHGGSDDYGKGKRAYFDESLQDRRYLGRINRLEYT